MTPRHIVLWSLLAAGVGAVLLFIGLLVDADRAWFSYLTVWTFGVTVCIGALLLLMTGHAAKASWMVVTRRITESIVNALPVYALLFVPLCFGLRHLYPWADPEHADPALRAAIEHKRAYLNIPFFVVRSAFYFAVFITVGTLLRAWSRANDELPRLALVRRMRALSGGALPLVGLTLTWAAFDWTMSLEPDWQSTIYGLYYFAGSFVGAIALVSIMLNLARMVPEVGLRVTPDHAQALGRVLFAMIVFWAYMAFSQLLIYWIANVPEEVHYYALRTHGTWSDITYLLVIGNFVFPGFVLLSRHLKRRPDFLASIAAWVFLSHFVDVYWLVMPVHTPAGITPHWLDGAAILFVGGLSCAWIVRAYARVAPIPLHAPELPQGIHYEASV